MDAFPDICKPKFQHEGHLLEIHNVPDSSRDAICIQEVVVFTPGREW